MRLTHILAVCVALLFAAVPVGASHEFWGSSDSGFFGSSDGFFGSGTRDRDRSVDDDDDGWVRATLTDGRTVWIDRDTYRLLRATDDAITDEDVEAVGNYRECELYRNGKLLTTDCSDVRPYERRALRQAQGVPTRGYSSSGGGFFASDPGSSLTWGLGGSSLDIRFV